MTMGLAGLTNSAGLNLVIAHGTPPVRTIMGKNWNHPYPARKDR